jgi:hypothetical protein
MAAFRALFGMTAGYGVHKKRPKYSDGQSLLNLNDVINAVLCPLQGDPGASSMDESDNCSRPFQWFGVMDDGRFGVRLIRGYTTYCAAIPQVGCHH